MGPLSICVLYRASIFIRRAFLKFKHEQILIVLATQLKAFQFATAQKVWDGDAMHRNKLSIIVFSS